jgi:hypothetical protein
MGEYDKSNDPQTGNSTSAQNAGNMSGQQGQQQQSGVGYGDQQSQGIAGQGERADGGFSNDDESRGGPPTGESIDDTGGLTSDQGARSGQGGMQQDATGSAAGSDMDDEEDSDTLQDQNSSGAV